MTYEETPHERARREAREQIGPDADSEWPEICATPCAVCGEPCRGHTYSRGEWYCKECAVATKTRGEATT
jgi:8-oxo-dGTP pyrophosphatase MutT (NUDIX family)